MSMKKYSIMMDSKDGIDHQLQLSPTTRFSIDLELELLKKNEDLLITIPSGRYYSLLLTAYEHSIQTRSTSVIVASEEFHEYNKTYYLLQTNNMPLYLNCPICTKSNNGIAVEPYILKTISSKQRNKLKNMIKSEIQNSDKPRIILTNERQFEKTSKDILSSIDYNGISLVIILDYNYRSFEQLKDLINTNRLEKTKTIVASTSIPTQIIQKVNTINGLEVISLNAKTINCAPLAADLSLSYFESEKYIHLQSSLDQFNIDSASMFSERKIPIEIIDAESGEIIPSQIARIGATLSKLQHIPTKLEIILKSISKISNQSIHSFCTIDNLKSYSSYFGYQVDAKALCDAAESFYSDLNSWQIHLCDTIINAFWTVRNEIEQCRNPFVLNGYTKSNKFSLLFDIINSTNDSNFILFTINAKESMILNNYLKISGKDHLAYVENTKDILNLDHKKYVLVLPGRPESSQSYILNIPFKKIIILSYKGKDHELTREFINDYTNGHELSKYLLSRAINTAIFGNENELFRLYPHFRPLAETVNITDNSTLNEKSSNDTPYYDDNNFGFDYFKEIQKTIESGPSICDDVQENGTLKVSLMNIIDGTKITRMFNPNKLFAVINEMTNSVDELPIDSIKPGSYIVARFGTEADSSSLLDTLIELYDLNQVADTSVVLTWEDAISSLNQMPLDEIYEEYLTSGGDKKKGTVATWINGRTMAPDSAYDIKIIGKIANIEEIENCYTYMDKEFNKIRNQKRMLGRHLFKIISDILSNTKSINLDPRTTQLREILEHRIYIVCDSD